jgi:hypothetical protein
MKALNALQLLHLAAHAGFPAKLQPEMAAIGLAESGGGKNPRGDVYCGQGATSFGIWQIHTRDDRGHAVNLLPGGKPYNEHRLVVDSAYNAKAALYVWRSQGLNAWSTHLHHEDRAFLPAARWAVGHDIRLVRRAHAHRKAQVTPRTLHPRPHFKPAADPILFATFNHIAICFILAMMFFSLWNLLRHIKRLFVIAIREDIAVHRRAARRRQYREEAAFRRRTLPRARRGLALATN